jgi:hypothetical protein
MNRDSCRDVFPERREPRFVRNPVSERDESRLTVSPLSETGRIPVRADLFFQKWMNADSWRFGIPERGESGFAPFRFPEPRNV